MKPGPYKTLHQLPLLLYRSLNSRHSELYAIRQAGGMVDVCVKSSRLLAICQQAAVVL